MIDQFGLHSSNSQIHRIKKNSTKSYENLKKPKNSLPKYNKDDKNERRNTPVMLPIVLNNVSDVDDSEKEDGTFIYQIFMQI